MVEWYKKSDVYSKQLFPAIETATLETGDLNTAILFTFAETFFVKIAKRLSEKDA